uniref:RING-type domain-containing protein n=1 Tax=Monopterus albus TaxID=43700 RepID=A0A3Q3JCE2_MONAL
MFLMADTEKSQLEEMLMCPVCQDIFKDPRQLPCGHSLCMGCLENMMDHFSDAPFRCPDCRTNFGQIMGVQKNYALANIADDFRENRRRRVPALSPFLTYTFSNCDKRCRGLANTRT